MAIERAANGILLCLPSCSLFRSRVKSRRRLVPRAAARSRKCVRVCRRAARVRRGVRSALDAQWPRGGCVRVGDVRVPRASERVRHVRAADADRRVRVLHAVFRVGRVRREHTEMCFALVGRRRAAVRAVRRDPRRALLRAPAAESQPPRDASVLCSTALVHTLVHNALIIVQQITLSASEALLRICTCVIQYMYFVVCTY